MNPYFKNAKERKRLEQEFEDELKRIEPILARLSIEKHKTEATLRLLKQKLIATDNERNEVCNHFDEFGESAILHETDPRDSYCTLCNKLI